MNYFGISGREYVIGDRPFASGGEGDVFNVENDNSLIFKKYHLDCITQELEEKIKYMSNNPPNSNVLKQVAWPIDCIYNSENSFSGFVMPKLGETIELSEVYIYPPQKEISFNKKLKIAQNICTVIDEVHKAGYIFGDFNPRNIGVNIQNCNVAFFDTDSYHIVLDKDNNKAFRCNVCASGYAAPELIKKCADYSVKHPEDAKQLYANVPLDTFTVETDNFALAVHIFRLLMNGFTPYSGIAEGSRASVASPGLGDTAVRRDNYCFKPGNKPQSVAVPPLETLPKEIRALFSKAFIKGRENPLARPNASEWKGALELYENNLKKCKANSSHMYLKTLKKCPWCEANKNFESVLNSPKNNTISTNTSSNVPPKVIKPVAVPPVSNTISQSRGKIGYIASLLGWMSFFYTIIFTLSLFSKNWSINLEKLDVKSINYVQILGYSFTSMFLLNFGTHLANGKTIDVSKVFTYIWGMVLCILIPSVYAEINQTNEIGELFGYMVMIAVVVVLIVVASSNLGKSIGNKYNCNISNKAKSVSDITISLILLGINAICIPWLLNISKYYDILSKHNVLYFAIWIIPALCYIAIMFSIPTDGISAIWLNATMITGFTLIILFLGYIGGMALLLWLILALPALFYLSFMEDFWIPSFIKTISTISIFVIFIVGGYLDIMMLNGEIPLPTDTIHVLTMGPALTVMVSSFFASIGEITK